MLGEGFHFLAMQGSLGLPVPDWHLCLVHMCLAAHPRHGLRARSLEFCVRWTCGLKGHCKVYCSHHVEMNMFAYKLVPIRHCTAPSANVGKCGQTAAGGSRGEPNARKTRLLLRGLWLSLA